MNEDMERMIKNIINPQAPITGEPVTPHPNPVNGDALLKQIYFAFKLHVICDDEMAVTAVLWIIFTWVIAHVDCAPIGIITAPEPRCGKTQALTTLGNLSYRPIQASNITSASLFHVINDFSPTLLIDEADTFLKKNKDLIGILNSGHTRNGAFVIRSGSKGKTKKFVTWGAKAIAGIGNMPETIMDRGVIMPVRRMLPDEKITPLHESAKLFESIRSSLARWSMDNGPRIPRVARVNIPGLNDRQNDNWRPLLAIAKLAGGKWAQYARHAAVKYANYCTSNCTSNSRDLLSDIYDIFHATGADRLTTEQLIETLCTYNPRLWGKFNKGTPITPDQISDNLTHFQITHGTIRPKNKRTQKGYYLKNFQDAFLRYLNHKSIDD